MAAAPARARELGDQRERPLLGAEVGEAQRGVGVEHDPQAHVGEVVALGDHLGSDQHARTGRLEAAQRADAAAPASATTSASRRKTGASASKTLRQLVLQALGAGAVAGDRSEQQSQQRAGDRLAVAAVVAGEVSAGAVQHERDVAVGTAPHAPAGRHERKFDQPRRLSSTIALPRSARTSASACAVSGCSRPGLAPHVQRRARRAAGARPRVAAARAARRRCTALRARRRAAEQQHGAPSARRARAATVARVVAGVALVLVGGVVLLVDDDQPETLDRREHRRARRRRTTRASPLAQPRHSS